MKIRLFLVVVFFIHINCFAAQTDVVQLVPVKAEITQGVDRVYNDVHKYLPDAYVYFMNITKADGYAIDVALVPANNIQDVLYNHEYTVNGYFKHNNITVFVFGIDDGYFFKKTAVKLDFPAFEKKIEPEGDPYITPALDIYEWKFAYKNNLLAFLKVGWFDFFDKKD